MKTILATFSLLFLFTACSQPSLSSGKVKKTYYTGGKLRSEFIMTDVSKKNGILKQYGYEGRLTSSAHIQNGVKHGIETWYDEEGRVIMKVPYVNGEKEGNEYAYYPNGDVMIATPYKQNMKHGTAKKFYQDGRIQGSATYRYGKRVR